MQFQQGPARIRVKLKDVAQRAGVSAGTVSHALNHPDRVAPATLARVRKAIADLGFAPNGAASALASGSTKTIGLVVIDLMNSLFVDITRGAQQAARAKGYNLQLADSDNDREQEESHLRFFHTAHVAGVLLAPITDPSVAVQRLRSQGGRVVLVNYFAERESCCTVLVDNERVGYLAAQHLIGLGRRRLAFVGGLHQVQPVRLRRRGVLRAIQETNGSVELIDMDTEDLEPSSGSKVGARLVSVPPKDRPDAVLAVTDLLAMAIISEFTVSGIRVPSDVAVMGCDHNSVAWGGAMPLTSVTMRGHDMGQAAFELMLREITEPAGVHEHRTVTLEPSLVIRESTVGR